MRIVVTVLMVLSLAAGAWAEDDKGGHGRKKDEPVPEAKVFTTQHTIRLGGQDIRYTATAGTMLMKNDKDKPIALFGFTAYVRDEGDKRTRPVLFAYNGGPGSASMWLHMGILGPQRTLLDDAAFTTEGPFRRVPNEFSVLDRADLVMIDPVGTGYARPVGKGKGKDFWGVDQDIDSVSKFIVKWLGENGRWQSPKYILGESYGGIRTGGVSYALLSKHNVALNGVVLVSPYMDLAGGSAGMHLDVPYVNYLPAYAATAWYHDALADKPADLRAFLKEAEAFAHDTYAPVLLKGHRASAEERKAVLAGLQRFTGISEDYWDRANLRIDESRFAQELLRGKRQTTGRIDARYKGDMINPLSEFFRYDPFFPAVGPAIVATFNDYYREDLKVQFDRPYVPSGDVYEQWDQSHQQPDIDGQKVPFPNTAVDLAYAMTQNPRMRVLVLQGYFDLATPYSATDYFIDHLVIADELRANISVKYYEAGHMMYVHPASMVQFARDLGAFITP
jgi:carboxypeptidase C (cathepsin A)